MVGNQFVLLWRHSTSSLEATSRDIINVRAIIAIRKYTEWF